MRKKNLLTDCLNEVQRNFPGEKLIIVETGTIRYPGSIDGDGNSTIEIAEWVKKNGGKFYSIDIKTDVCEKYLKEKGLSEYVNLVKSESLDALPELDMIHFAYLDSAENSQHCFDEFISIAGIMGKGSVIVCDDCVLGSETIKKAQKVYQFCVENKFNIELVNNYQLVVRL